MGVSCDILREFLGHNFVFDLRTLKCKNIKQKQKPRNQKKSFSKKPRFSFSSPGLNDRCTYTITGCLFSLVIKSSNNSSSTAEPTRRNGNTTAAERGRAFEPDTLPCDGVESLNTWFSGNDTRSSAYSRVNKLASNIAQVSG